MLIAARLRWAVGCPADGQLLGPDGFLRPHSDPLPVNVLTDDQACHSPQMQVYFHACELLVSESLSLRLLPLSERSFSDIVHIGYWLLQLPGG